MPTKEQVIARVGLKTWNTMLKTGYLDGITVKKNKDGTVEIPAADIDRAYRAAKGDKYHDWIWNN
jgi:hypothetical protein